MQRKRMAALALSALALSAYAVAQTPTPVASAASLTAPTLVQTVARPVKTSAAAPRSTASTDADARHCLERTSNSEVIACAEAYRPHGKKNS